MEEDGKRVVGIDLAKRSYVACLEDPKKGTRLSWTGKTDESGLEGLFSKLTARDTVGMEACAFAFYVAKRLKTEVGCEVYVLNPGQLSIIFKSMKKTDLEDAVKIAFMLNRFAVEELPTVSLPTEQEEHRRALVSELAFKKHQRTRLINRLHSLFVRVGITDLETKDLKEETTRLDTLDRLSGYTLAEALRIQEELELIEKHIRGISQEIKEDLKTEPLARNLLSVPGVGIVTAMAFIAHVGDGSRFLCGRQVSNFVGITPRIDNSGETVRIGHITKRGCKAIRAVIIQAAWAAVHSKTSNRFKVKYQEIAERRGKGRAIVAIARRMVEILWLVSSRQVLYDETTEPALTKKMRLLGLIQSKGRGKKAIMEPAA